MVGYDDIEPASWDAYSLSTMRQPLAEMVTAATNLLLARIHDPHRLLEIRQFPNELLFAGRPTTGISRTRERETRRSAGRPAPSLRRESTRCGLCAARHEDIMRDLDAVPAACVTTSQ